jgi:hypothetical protein
VRARKLLHQERAPFAHPRGISIAERDDEPRRLAARVAGSFERPSACLAFPLHPRPTAALPGLPFFCHLLSSSQSVRNELRSVERLRMLPSMRSDVKSKKAKKTPQRFIFVVPAEERAMIEKLAAKDGVSMAAAIRMLIRRGFEQLRAA